MPCAEASDARTVEGTAPGRAAARAAFPRGLTARGGWRSLRAVDRITRLRIKNVRAIECVDLAVSPVTVLIGENGSGKSTILECLEVLRRVAEERFFEEFYAVHRGMPGLLRRGARALSLGVTVEDVTGQSPRLDYDFSLGAQGAGAAVVAEQLTAQPVAASAEAQTILRRDSAAGEVLRADEGVTVAIKGKALRDDRLLLGSFGTSPPHPAIERLQGVLRGVEVHLPFDTIAAWAARSYQFTMSLRGSSLLQPARRLDLLGFNLANAWAALKNQDSVAWSETLALVRLGLGDDIDTVHVDPDAGGGNVSISLRRVGLAEPIPAANLSDGQLVWLAFLAMARLHEGRSLLAVDEPEQHLHPSLLGRVMSLLTGTTGGAPVVLSTHSDRVLELLDDPAASTRVCRLDQGKATVSHLDAEALPRWLERFGDLGRLRASGYLPRVIASEPST